MDRRDSTKFKVFVLHVTNPGFISSTAYGFLEQQQAWSSHNSKLRNNNGRLYNEHTIKHFGSNDKGFDALCLLLKCTLSSLTIDGYKPRTANHKPKKHHIAFTTPNSHLSLGIYSCLFLILEKYITSTLSIYQGKCMYILSFFLHIYIHTYN